MTLVLPFFCSPIALRTNAVAPLPPMTSPVLNDGLTQLRPPSL